MSCDLLALATNGVAGLRPYQPGKPVEELQRELGLETVVKLASNENPLGCSPSVQTAIKNFTEYSRYPDGNAFTLKNKLAKLHGVAADQITIGNGSNEILELIARAIVTTEHNVIFSEHAFAVYPLVTQAIGASSKIVSAKDWGNDLDAIIEAIDEHTRLIFLANPNNPTGTWFNHSDLIHFLQQLPSHVIVVLDEAYYEYASTEDYPDSVNCLEQFPNLLISRTFSKAYGLASLRIGYALSHPDLADLLNRVRQPFNSNALAMLAAEVALDDQDFIKHSVEINLSGMQQLTTAFDSMGLHYIPSMGNFISVNLQQSGNDIYQQLLQKGVIVRPVDNYGMPEYIRVTIGQEQENQYFLNALVDVLA